jgi:hypothetical protein
VFTARYALSPYIKQIRFVFKGLISSNTSFGQSKSHSRHCNCRGPVLWFRLRFLSFFKGALLLNVNTIVQREFSNCKTSSAWYLRIYELVLIHWVWGHTTISTEWHKSNWRKSEDHCSRIRQGEGHVKNKRQTQRQVTNSSKRYVGQNREVRRHEL